MQAGKLHFLWKTSFTIQENLKLIRTRSQFPHISQFPNITRARVGHARAGKKNGGRSIP